MWAVRSNKIVTTFDEWSQPRKRSYHLEGISHNLLPYHGLVPSVMRWSNSFMSLLFVPAKPTGYPTFALGSALLNLLVDLINCLIDTLAGLFGVLANFLRCFLAVRVKLLINFARGILCPVNLRPVCQRLGQKQR